MSGIARLLHQLREQFFIQRHTAGLAWPDDLVLQASVDLKEKTKNIDTRLGNRKVLSLHKEEPSHMVVTV